MAGPFNITPATLINDIDVGLGLFSGGGSGDIVAIIDQQSLTQLFQAARPLKVEVKEGARVMEHPVESGSMIADFRVIRPKEIDLSLIIPAPDFSSTYEQIRSAFTNSTLLSVQTKTDVYQNMIIAEMPHTEDPEMFDVITLAMHLREVLFVVPVSVASQPSPVNYSPAVPTDQKVVPRGVQNTTTIPAAFTVTDDTFNTD